jgi:hypothetical protein
MLISRETVATAFHEAGHAVVGHQLTGEVPRKISVIPEGGSVGRIRNRPWPRSFKPLVRMTPLSRQRLEDETVKILSGFEAERRHTGRADHHGAAEDFKGAKVYAGLIVGDDAEGVAAYIKWCSYLARRAVEWNWEQIGRFARRLADAGELEGRDLKKALTAASWAGPVRSRWRGKW